MAKERSDVRELRAILGDALEVTNVLRSMNDEDFDTVTVGPLVREIVEALKKARRIVKLRNPQLHSVASAIGKNQGAYIRSKLALIANALVELLASPNLEAVTPEALSLLRDQAYAIEMAIDSLLRLIAVASANNEEKFANLIDSTHNPHSRLSPQAGMPRDVFELLRSLIDNRRTIPKTKLQRSANTLEFVLPHSTEPVTKLNLFRFYIDDQGTIIQRTFPAVQNNTGPPWQLFPRPGTRRLALDALIEAFGIQMGLVVPPPSPTDRVQAFNPRHSAIRVFQTGQDKLLVVNKATIKLAMMIDDKPHLFSADINLELAHRPAFEYTPGGADPFAAAGGASALFHVLSTNPLSTSPSTGRQICTYTNQPIGETMRLLLISSLEVPSTTTSIVASGRMLAAIQSPPSAVRPAGSLFGAFYPERADITVYQQPSARDLVKMRLSQALPLDAKQAYTPIGGTTLNLRDVSPDCRVSDCLVDDAGNVAVMIRYSLPDPTEGATPLPGSEMATKDFIKVLRFDVESSNIDEIFETSSQSRPGAPYLRDLALGPRGQMVVSLIVPKTSPTNEAVMYLAELTPSDKPRDYTIWHDDFLTDHEAATKYTHPIVIDRNGFDAMMNLSNVATGASESLPTRARPIKAIGDSILMGHSYTKSLHEQVDRLLTALDDFMHTTPSRASEPSLQAAMSAVRQIATLSGTKLLDYGEWPSRENGHVMAMVQLIKSGTAGNLVDMFRKLTEPLYAYTLETLSGLTTATSNNHSYNLDSRWVTNTHTMLQQIRVLLAAAIFAQ